jgi:membrane-bound metal-dependent hydrolase YbcI (DUF457 family)
MQVNRLVDFGYERFFGMSGIGHLAPGFIGKTVEPKLPLLVLIAAAETNDLLYFLFSAVGIEKSAEMTMDFTKGVRYLGTGSNPWSHGLLMSAVWALLAGLLGYVWYRDKRPAFTLGLVVFSHWVLDFLMHSNLPLFFDGSPMVGLGLENSGPGFVFITVLDIVFLIFGIAYYSKNRKKGSGVILTQAK